MLSLLMMALWTLIRSCGAWAASNRSHRGYGSHPGLHRHPQHQRSEVCSCCGAAPAAGLEGLSIGKQLPEAKQELSTCGAHKPYTIECTIGTIGRASCTDLYSASSSDLLELPPVEL